MEAYLAYYGAAVKVPLLTVRASTTTTCRVVEPLELFKTSGAGKTLNPEVPKVQQFEKV